MSPPFWFRRALLVVIVVLLGHTALILLALALIDMLSGGRQKVLIDSVDSDSIAAITMMVAFGLTGVALCLIPVPKGGLLLMVPARLLAFAAIWPAYVMWVFSAGATVTPLLSDGCETGYVVEEEYPLLGARGTVYEANGLLVARVAPVRIADNTKLPFANGLYIAERDGDLLRVRYDDGYSNPRQQYPVHEPTFTVPVRVNHDCDM